VTRRSVRSDLYWSARRLGTAQAAMRGPKALAKREGRRVIYRGANRGLGRLLRGVGLMGRR
jgi:hypothetical protein